MAHLWVRETAAQWAIVSLAGKAVSIAEIPPKPVPPGSVFAPRSSGVILLGSDGAPGVWALIAGQGTDVRVNGTTLASGIRILDDKDEITVGYNPPIFYSTERLASVEEYPGADATAFCPRCKQALRPNHPAVKCPGCSVFYHQSEELPCWTYSEVCALCPQVTALDSGYQWSPEGL